MEYSQIAYEVTDHVATITLNRPEKLNAFTNRMMRELVDAFDRGHGAHAGGQALRLRCAEQQHEREEDEPAEESEHGRHGGFEETAV